MNRNFSATLEVIDITADPRQLLGRRASGEHGRRPARDAALIYAEMRLKMWAAWAKDHRGALGLPTISLLFKAMMEKSLTMRTDRSREEREGPELTARGKQTMSFRPATVGEIPEAIEKCDRVVAGLPEDPHTVIVADFFTYGPIEVRCKRTPWKRARYSQLLEVAKYLVYAGLKAIE